MVKPLFALTCILVVVVLGCPLLNPTTDKVAIPTFNPPAGTYSINQSVSISCATSGAAIHYTTDSTTPSESSALYKGPISVAGDDTATTIQAIATKTGMTDSAVASAGYIIKYSQVATPTFNPGVGTYSSALTVTISTTTAGASIRYTTDGSTPTSTVGTLYSSPINVETSVTIKAIAYASSWTDSTVAIATYALQVATPTFDPPEGMYSSDQSVTISCATIDAAIYYTTDGTPPSENSTLYTGPISIAGNGTKVTIKAIATKGGMTDSTVGSAALIINYPVCGIISVNTTWTAAKSPYRLSCDVQVDFGVTLVIEPGVTVVGNGKSLVIGGTLTGLGSVNSRIMLNDVHIKPAGQSSKNHRIEVRFANIQGGSLYAPTGSYGTLALSDSRVESLITEIYIWLPTSTVSIERNVFLNSEGISAGFNAMSTPIEVIVRNNYFANWLGDYAIENWLAYGSTVGVRAEFNTFATPNRIAVRLPPGYTPAALTATNNWWGTTDTSIISAMIFDRNDDITSAGVIEFQPILTSPDPATPTP